VALCVTCYQLGARFGHLLGRPAISTLTASAAIEKVLAKGIKRPESDIDIIGYSVHAILDTVQPLVVRALKARKRVRVLMLSPWSFGLIEKSRMERAAQGIEIDALRSRNRDQIQKTCEALAGLRQTVRYQAGLAHPDLDVRL